MTTVSFSVPTPTGSKQFDVEKGSSLLIVGANGSGKTRLAVRIEKDLGINAHRISAHRLLSLNPNVDKISMAAAKQGLRLGHASAEADIGLRRSQRWQSNEAVAPLNDYNFLLQLLYAEQNSTALDFLNKARAGHSGEAKETNFEKLKNIWEDLFSHRKLVITADNISVKDPMTSNEYKAAEMSDGERAAFYLIGQTLCAEENSTLIFDEPELHIHRAIMSRIWDKLEAARSDCAFILITHDLEFVASRTGQKFVIRDYNPVAEIWDIEEVPETGFNEEITTKILGSRKPILFVEGTASSLDYAVYRSCYPQWTIVPRNSCEEVIHAVVTMRNNASLTRITCAGIVDADDYNFSEISHLNSLGIKVLPVSEIENLFLLPNVARTIGTHEGFTNGVLEDKIQTMKNAIFVHVQQAGNVEKKVIQYCRRRIDRRLKKIDLSDAASVSDIAAQYATETTSLNVAAIAEKRRNEINTSISNKDLTALMSLYDDKGLVSFVAQHMRATRKTDFESWIVRVLGNNSVTGLIEQIKAVLPVISPN